MSGCILEARDLCKCFRLTRGELVSISGPSGSGKSTLLGLLGGLGMPTSGQIIFDGVDVSQMNERQA